MRDGVGSQIVGGLVVGITGIIIIAAIFQLGQKGNPIVPATGAAYNTTLGALFK